MRQTVICGNWKMNKTVQESEKLAHEILNLTKGINDITIIISPTYLATAKVASIVKNTQVKLAVQDVHFDEQGAYTGKVAVDMVKALGVDYVILGHSEQRLYFGETNENVNKKVMKVLAGGMTPIICVGETIEERQGGQLQSVLKKQITSAYAGIPENNAAKTIIAYEPVWAIGTGITATNEQAQNAHLIVRTLIRTLYSDEVANSIIIQYGGSMKASTAKGLVEQEDIDGGLIGGAALNAESFSDIIRQCSKNIN